MQPQIKVALNFLNILSFQAEKEVEKLLKSILPGSPYSGLVKAVGGYVRDQYISLLKNDPSIEAKDLDLVVNMKDGAKKVTHYIYDLFKEKISSPKQLGETRGYPIWQITFKDDINYKNEIYNTKGAVLEFADTMKETYPDPKSRQRETSPGGTLEDDLERRDFTTNMLLKDMTTGEIEDLTGQSKQDIEKGILRGHPNVNWETMFSNDPIRILRLYRFSVKYDWDIPLSVLRAVKKVADRINIIPKEQIQKEIEKIANLGKLKQAIKLMSATGLLKHVLPEIEALKGIKQSPKHHSEGSAYRHTLKVLENAPPGVENQMAALLHDVGKASTTKMIEDEIHAYGHEEVGADIAEAVMKRLKFENDATERVKKMVRNHMRGHHLAEASGTKAIRKFIRDVGDELVDSILNLARADELGKIPATNNIPDLIEKIKKVRETSKDKITEKAILDGKEIMDLLKIPTGAEVGRAKKILLEIEDDYAEKGEKLTKDVAKKELLTHFHEKKGSFTG